MKNGVLSTTGLSSSARPLKNTGVGLATQIARVLLPLSICMVSTGASAAKVTCKFTHVGKIYASDDRLLRTYIVDDVWERTGRAAGRGEDAEDRATTKAEGKIKRAVISKANDECSGKCEEVKMTVEVTDGPCKVEDTITISNINIFANLGAD